MVTTEASESLEGLNTLQEVGSALKNMKSDQSPGPNGFTDTFFKFFFVDIESFLVRSINEGFEKGQLSASQRSGIITCLPKD